MIRKIYNILKDILQLLTSPFGLDKKINLVICTIEELEKNINKIIENNDIQIFSKIESSNRLLIENHNKNTEFLLNEISIISAKMESIATRQQSRPYYALDGNWGLTQLNNELPFYVNRQTRDITPWILLIGSWENFVDDILCALVEPTDCFVDVGANIGYYTIKIGNQIGPEGKVFSFEPNPEMCCFIRENVSINGFYDRVTLINAGAGDAAGELSFVVDPVRPGGGTIYAEDERPIGVEAISVPVVTVDESLPEDRVVDLIKIDVEGFEAKVFDGMARTLARSPEAAIVTEFNYIGWSRFGDPIEMLSRYAGDRRLFRIFHDGRLQEMAKGELAAELKGNIACYFLMLPKTARRTRQIDRYLQRFAAA